MAGINHSTTAVNACIHLFKRMGKLFTCPRLPQPVTAISLVTIFMWGLEEQWWAFIDTIEAVYGRISLSFADFLQAWHECNGIPGLARDAPVSHLAQQFETHKRTVPVCCALLVSTDEHLLLVRATVSRRRNWMLPGGKRKMHENESAHACVVREVAEETGLDIGAYEKQVFEMCVARRAVTVFLVRGMPRGPLPPIPNTKEIAKVEWVDIDSAQRMPRMNPLVWHVLPLVLPAHGRRRGLCVRDGGRVVAGVHTPASQPAYPQKYVED
jgi:ADP-ribose pyrophosphatase YjhB (NUDIX family)